MSTEATEYAARLAFQRDMHQIREEFHRKLRERNDEEINRIGQKLGMQESEKKGYNYNADEVSWVDAEGPHGKYQKTDDVNNPNYKMLRADLAQHDGKLTYRGYFFWTFKNGVTIGRKKASYEKKKQ